MTMKNRTVIYVIIAAVAVIAAVWLITSFQLKMEQSFGRFVSWGLILLLVFAAGWVTGRFGGRKEKDGGKERPCETPTHMMKRLSIFIIAMLAATTACGAGIGPSRLTCEHSPEPLTENIAPRFSWVNEPADDRNGAGQSAYRIRVATSPDFSRRSLVWDSGRVESERSLYVVYGGPALVPCETYWWQVRVWDERGRASEWSDAARWHTGIFSPDGWKGRWIGVPWQGEESYDVAASRTVSPAPLLRREFTLGKEVAEARFYGTGLGDFELYVNGSRVGDEYLSPNQTNYDRRPKLTESKIVVPDPFNEYTVMYISHDITPFVHKGDNVVGALLGNGFYCLTKYWATLGYGSPRMMGQIEITYTDGSRETIPTDTLWRCTRSAIVSDQIYGGEHYDARLEHDGWNLPGYDDSAWEAAVGRKAPCGKLIPQNGPADRITARYAPESLERLSNGVWRVSFPEEISGWVELRHLDLERGERIDIRYINEMPNGSNSYTAKGSGDESYHARFTWFVFSQVEISGIDSLKAGNIEAHAVNSDVRSVSRFSTSNGLLDTINHIWRRSQLDNMHGSLASDCPHRERSAYTGDGQLACVTVMHNFDTRSFYDKWIRDIRGAQRPDGYVPNAAPWQPGCGGGVGWGLAIEVMPWEFYMHYGDVRLLEENFEAMKAHTCNMLQWVGDDGTMESRHPQYWLNLGDWLAPRQNPEKALVHTFCLWLAADITSRTAGVLGFDGDRVRFAALRDSTARAFHRRFYNAAEGSYGKYGSNVLALRMGVPDECRSKVIGALKRNLRETDNHIDTGIIGTRYLFEVLCDCGLEELAYEIINKRTQPGFGWWIAQGATTTWERWDGRDSRNHPMFGGGIGWFYRDLAGLRIMEPGFRRFEVRPVIPDGLDRVEYSLDTVYGTIGIHWRRDGNRFTLDCTVPVGTEATVCVPCGTEAAACSNRIPHEKVSDGRTIYVTPPGHYRFESLLTQ